MLGKIRSVLTMFTASLLLYSCGTSLRYVTHEVERSDSQSIAGLIMRHSRPVSSIESNAQIYNKPILENLANYSVIDNYPFTEGNGAELGPEDVLRIDYFTERGLCYFTLFEHDLSGSPDRLRPRVAHFFMVSPGIMSSEHDYGKLLHDNYEQLKQILEPEKRS